MVSGICIRIIQDLHVCVCLCVCVCVCVSVYGNCRGKQVGHKLPIPEARQNSLYGAQYTILL